MANGVGEISFYSDRAHWKIPYFLDIPHKFGTVIHSPYFHFKDRKWIMRIYPNGSKVEDPGSEGWFGMKVSDCTTSKPCRCYVRFGIIGKFERDIVNHTGIEISGLDGCSAYSRTRLIPRSTIESNKDSIVPGGVLHLFCNVEKIGGSAVNSVQLVKETGGR